MSSLPVETDTRRRLRLLAAQTLAPTTGFGRQPPPVLPGIRPNTALMNAGFPLGVAQRTPVAPAPKPAKGFGIPQPSKNKPFSQIVSESYAAETPAQRLDTRYALNPFLEALQQRVIVPAGALGRDIIAEAIPGTNVPLAARARAERSQGVGFLEAARRASEVTPAWFGERGASEILFDPTNLFPGVGFGGDIAKGAAKVARVAPPLAKAGFQAPARLLLGTALGEGGKAADLSTLAGLDKAIKAGERLMKGAPKADILPSTLKMMEENIQGLRELRDSYIQNALSPEEYQAYQDAFRELDMMSGGGVRVGHAPLFGTAERETWVAERRAARESGQIVGVAARTAANARKRVILQNRIKTLEAQVDAPVNVEGAAPTLPGGQIQAGMGIGEKSQQGTLLGEFQGKGAPSVPLIDQERIAAQQARAAEVARGQRELPGGAAEGPSVAAVPAGQARAPRARVRRAAAKPAEAPLAAEPAPGAILERGAVPQPAAPLPLAAGQGLPPPAPAAPVPAESPAIQGQREALERATAARQAAEQQFEATAREVDAAAAGAPPPGKPPVGEAAPTTGQPERGFITHTAESPMGSPILRKLYDEEPIVSSPITNKETLAKASEAVNADPVAARARLMDDAPLNPETMVDDLAQGFVLMRKAANEGNVVELRDLSKRIAERYTPVAQALQVASTIDKLSPEGLFVYTQRIIEQAVAKGQGTGVANRLRTAARRAEVKEATANAAADVAGAEEKVAQARKNVSNAAETAARVRTPSGNQRAKDLQYLIDDTVREVQAKLTPAERQAIIKAKAILKQSVAEMDVATANSFLDRAAELKDLDGEARVKALMGLVDEVRQLPQVQAGIATGRTLKPSPKLLKQQASDLAQLVDRTSRNVFQQLNSVDRLAVARVKSILRRTDVELPQGMAEELLREAHALRGLPLADRATALNKLTQKIKSFDPVAKELARKKVVADAEARVRQAARQAANDLTTLIDASSRKVVKHVTDADRLAISQAKTVLRRFGAELPPEMAQDFLTRAKALNNLPEAEQAAGVKSLVNEIKSFDPVKQAQDELVRLRTQAAAAKQSAKDLQYLAYQEMRVSKARLRNVERDTIRSAKARLKDSGVEMPEELAQSFLDRVKALRGITDEYDQMRAAQSLLADVNNLVPGSKINAFFDIIGLPRIFQAAYDLSFSLRQGIIHAWANPKLWGRMVKTGLESFASEDAALAADRQFFKRPLHKPLQEAGLEYIDRWGSIGQQEETYINRWTDRVPGVRQSNRAYTVQGNKLRGDSADAEVMKWLPPDVAEEVYWGRKRFETLDELVAATGKSRQDFEKLAQWENVKTGRGNLGNFLRSNNQWLSALFYAPRFAVSRFELPVYAIRNMARNPALRKMVAKDLAVSIVGSTAALYALGKLPGVTVEWDPRSSDFRKVKVGPLRMDMDGGFNTLIRQVVQISLSQRKSTTTGEIRDVVPTDLIWDFIQSKFAPVGSFSGDALDREDSVGNKLDTPGAWAKRVAQAWAPFLAQDVYEATQELGAPGIGVAPLSAFGAGVNTYESRGKPTPHRRRTPSRTGGAGMRSRLRQLAGAGAK